MDTSAFTPRLFLLIAAGGVLGTFVRYVAQLLLQSHAGAFPWGTLTVNVLGSFAFGFFVRYVTGGGATAAEMRIALTVGFCGAFTTMSSFSYETLVLIETGRYGPAVSYLAASIVGSLAAMASGLLLANSVR